MSYDLSIEFDACPHCDRSADSIEVGNVTSNVSPIIEKVWKATDCKLAPLGEGRRADDAYSWKRLDGHRLSDVLPAIERALAWFDEYEYELQSLNPENGWGSTGCVRRILAALLDAAERGAGGRVRVR